MAVNDDTSGKRGGILPKLGLAAAMLAPGCAPDNAPHNRADEAPGGKMVQPETQIIPGGRHGMVPVVAGKNEIAFAEPKEVSDEERASNVEKLVKAAKRVANSHNDSAQQEYQKELEGASTGEEARNISESMARHVTFAHRNFLQTMEESPLSVVRESLGSLREENDDTLKDVISRMETQLELREKGQYKPTFNNTPFPYDR